MVVDMCHFTKSHKARSWNNLNLILFWFSASQNAPDLEMGGPPLGFGESRNASNDGTITVPEPSSATPRILQEGWSEPAATNAPVEDEPVQPVLRMNILPVEIFFFTSSLP